ncbi:TIGR02171 family protein [Fibrobacter succinogenes]|uniref:TIGR02171 family lipoprotein n=1 Tax=Fibrobacter succinogenes TaxID=833 RepID=UPI00350E35D3
MRFSLAVSMFSVLFFACSNSETPIPYDEESPESSESSGFSAFEDLPEIEGMILVHGGTVTLGTDDTKYRPSERPAMKVVLDYDFNLDVHEVTCGEYRELAKKTGLKDFGTCESDSLPLSNVTYYDAVLFANAKGKFESRDTAYTYSNAVYDTEGHCTNLEGFSFHPEVVAYRLPTEAEWVFAASQGWDPENRSWNADNSEYRAHAVCSAGADSLGFCDLAGNVKEWVNDWAGVFCDTIVTNYVGAPDGGALGERVLKGGYFSDRASEMNVVARGDEYTVVASTRAERLGFRLAFGFIPDPVWLGTDGRVVSSIVTPLASAASLKALTGSFKMILAFRNDISGNLAYIDYNEVNLSVTEIEDDMEVFHPDVSPDGMWVAFCTKPEGVAGKSELYVRNLNKEGSNLVKLDVESAAIPRWRVLGDGDTVIVYVTDAGNNKDDAAFKSTSTWQVKFAGGKFGAPKKLFDGAFHGGISEDNTLAVTGARLLRTRIANSGSTLVQDARDAVWYDSAQACNASLAQDGSKRTAFLDFGGKLGRKFAGESYATHERILVADSSGNLVQTLKAPAGYTFDHSEWAGDGETSNIVATLVNIAGAHTKIVLVSPSDSSVLKLVSGAELWHPCLWVKKANSAPVDTGSTEFVLDPDSAGIYYNSSGASTNDIYYRYKMELLWQYRNSINVVVLGSSRALRGVNPNEFRKPVFAVNMAIAATVINAHSFLFYNYVLPHCKNLKAVVISIDLDRGANTGDNSNNIFHEAYKSYPGYVYDMNHNFWKDSFPPKLASLTYDSPGSQEMAKKLRPVKGFHSTASHGWGDPVITGDSCWMDKRESIYRSNFDLFVELLKTCKERNIYVIGVIFPTNPRYAETGAYGYAGLRRSEAPALIQELAELHKTYPNFILMDENKMGNHDYGDNLANDYSHLSHSGAAVLTARIDSLIKTLNIDFGE